ncbi:Alpha/Beta hydrolase protein [Chaetomium tenue]|uniref:Alpha/Beta hydrolase protein n=1 Tax=Chaetomium tenue TaxID=1854479 RepID=A0ACB7NVU8_9PEZI|nr:Alpha/Beta hydrolase protein [Chaetomium globosum]
MRSAQNEDIPRRVFQAIASELHVPVDEFEQGDTEFAELGVDSLVAPSIIAKIARATAIQLPEDIFETTETVAGLRQHLATLAPPPPPLPPTSTPTVSPPILIRRATITTTKKPNTNTNPNPNPTPPRNLFLLPDGSGAAMAYARLPALPHTHIYALNSPFLPNNNTTTNTTTTNPTTYTCTLPQLAAAWAAAITALQPRGPYLLGGWSAGGYYAYEVARWLARRGLVVQALVLVDSPCRVRFGALPLGVGGGAGKGGREGAPEWLVRHFEGTLRAVEAYVPEGFADGLGEGVVVPRVYIIWASEAVVGKGEVEAAGLDPDVKVTRMLLEPRSDFGPNGWDTLFPDGTELVVSTIPCNHFEIVHPPNVEVLGSLLGDIASPKGEAGWVNEWQKLTT